MGVYVCVIRVTLLVCNTGVNNPCCTGVCIERVYPEVSIAAPWSNVGEQYSLGNYF